MSESLHGNLLGMALSLHLWQNTCQHWLQLVGDYQYHMWCIFDDSQDVNDFHWERG